MAEQTLQDSSSDGGLSKMIPLAIDPNLIRPIRSAAPHPGDVERGPEPDPAPTQSLVSNPYERFGNMPLEQLIPLILQSRGVGYRFADLSEEELQEEVLRESLQPHELQDADGDVGMDESQFTSDPDQQGPNPQQIEDARIVNEEQGLTQEQFQQLKANTVQSLNLAVNESSLALEFVSLLLSSVRPSAANASMSPFLKKTVPSASLNAEKIPFEKPFGIEILDSNLVTKGWKLRSLEEARTLLKGTYQALGNSLEREHSYWSKVSQFISKRDVVFKMKDKETGEKSLGIKYGYEDSGSKYRQERGIAVLRHNTDADRLELIPAENQRAKALGKGDVEHFMRVRIFTKIEEEDDYILSGESSPEMILSSGLKANQGHDIRRQISKLKFLIFEKELMYRLKKESEDLVSYGASTENENKITVELPTEKIEIEMMQVSDDTITNHDQDAPKTNDKKATLILAMLRMLLVVMYKKQLRQKLLSPQISMGSSTKHSKEQTSGKSSEIELLLLRPIIGKFKHENYLRLLQKVISTYVLDVVEGSTSKKVAHSDNLSSAAAQEETYDNHILRLDREIRLFDKILKMPRSELLVDLPNSGTIRFVLTSSNYCNYTTTVVYRDSSGKTLFDTKFSNFKELEDFLHFIISEYTAADRDGNVKEE